MGETAAKVMDGAPRFPARVTPVEDAASKNWKPATTHCLAFAAMVQSREFTGFGDGRN